MMARRDRVLMAVCLLSQASILLGIALAARSGCLPSTVVAGLAISFVPYAGLLAVSRSHPRPSAAGLVAIVLLLGVPLVFAPPVLSDDLYRYVWEGRLWLEGFNPYQLAPDDLALSPLRDDVWLRINNKAIGSIYPPISQLLFVVVAWFGGKVWTVKALALLAHMLTVAVVAAIAKSNNAPLALGLNPLLLGESALNGHLDILCGLALLVTAWALGQHRYVRAGIAACTAVGLKVVGLVLLPLFALRPRVLLAVSFVSLILLAPLIVSRGPVSGAVQFASRWRGNESLFAFAHWASRQLFADDLVELAARLMVAVVLLFVCALVVKRRPPASSAARSLVWAALLLSPQVHPWYLAWLLPLELMAGGSAGLAWTAVVLCAYAPLDLWVTEGVWRMPAWLQTFEYSVVALALLADPQRPTLRGAAPDGQFPI